MGMLKIGRSKKAEHHQSMSSFISSSLTKVWATPCRYLRENMIRAFIEGIGHDTLNIDDRMMIYAKEDSLDRISKDGGNCENNRNEKIFSCE